MSTDAPTLDHARDAIRRFVQMAQPAAPSEGGVLDEAKAALREAWVSTPPEQRQFHREVRRANNR